MAYPGHMHDREKVFYGLTASEVRTAREAERVRRKRDREAKAHRDSREARRAYVDAQVATNPPYNPWTDLCPA